MAKPTKSIKNTTPQKLQVTVNSTAKTNNSIYYWLPALLLAALGFLLFANTLSHGWALDDYSVIKDNYVTQQGTKGISTLMNTEYRFGYWNSTGSLYRPLSLVMFATEWEYYPDNPWIGHFMNVLLFSITAIVMFFTLCNLLKNNSIAIPFVITALFVAHPTHVEVVANIKSRDEILALLFSLSTLHFLLKYIDSSKMVSLIMALFCYAIALFSKESAITFLAIFPLAIYFFREISLSQIIKTSALLLIPAVIFLMKRQSVLGGQAVLDNISLLDNAIVQDGVPKFAGAVAMLLYYAKAMFLPLTMVSDLGYNAVPLSGWGDWKVWVSLLLNGGLLGYAFLNLKKKDPVAFGILFFYITFSVSSNIFITIGTSYGERLVYASSLGFVLALVFFLYKLIKTSPNLDESAFAFLAKSTIFSSVIGLFCLFFAAKTITRNPVWKDSLSLYEADVQQYSEGVKLNYHYGLELTKKGRDSKDPTEKNMLLEKAMRQFEKALSIYPKYKDAYGEMGLAYFYKGDNTKAMECYQKAVAIQPDAKVYSNMGMIFFQQSNLAEAQRVYEKSLELDPRYVDGLRNLGSALAMQGKFKEAIPYFKKAIDYKPKEAILYFFLGSAYRDSGDATTAQQYFNKAYQLDPKLKK